MEQPMCLGDLLGFIQSLGEDDDSPIEFYINNKRAIVETIVSDETGTVGIYLKEE